MENIQFIRATKADISIVMDMRMRFSEELVGKQDRDAEAALGENIIAYLNEELDKNYLCWYATVNGEVASIAGMVIRTQPGNMKNPSGKWGYIMSVYTIPQHRRKGLSAAILDKLLDSARERGITAFELHATKEGEPVYVKNGFIMHDEPTYRKFLPAK